MGMEATIEVAALRKRVGSAVALDGLSFMVLPGLVTGLSGPTATEPPGLFAAGSGQRSDQAAVRVPFGSNLSSARPMGPKASAAPMRARCDRPRGQLQIVRSPAGPEPRPGLKCIWLTFPRP